jgi:hypothetical protein
VTSLEDKVLDGVAEVWPPKPGGLIDRHRQAEAARAAAEAEAKHAAEDIGARAYAAVKVAEEMPEVTAARTVVVSQGTGIVQLLGADPLRRRALVWTLDEPVVMASDLASASDSNNVLAGNVTPPATTTTAGDETSPEAGETITSQTLTAGVYTVAWAVQLSGTLAAADMNNFVVKVGTSVIAQSLNANVTGTFPQPELTVVIPPAGANVVIDSNGSGTTGAVYAAQLTVTSTAAAVPTVNASGSVLPVGFPLALDDRHEWFVVPTSAAATRVCFITESYAPRV